MINDFCDGPLSGLTGPFLLDDRYQARVMLDDDETESRKIERSLVTLSAPHAMRDGEGRDRTRANIYSVEHT